MSKLEDYIKSNKQKLKGYNPTTTKYQHLEKTIIEQEQNLANIRIQFDKLPDKNKGWINTAVHLNRHIQEAWTQFLWFRYTDLSDEEVFGCWRPPLKQIEPNPIDALIPNKEAEKLPPPANREREYERYYVALASIHDNMLTGVQSISNGIWPKELAECVWFRFTDAQPYGPDKGFIEAALERVQAEIASGQKSPSVVEYLSGLLKLLEELQKAIESKDEKNIRTLDRRDGRIEKYIGSIEHLADVLRECQSKYGCYNEYAHSALDWVSGATPSKGSSPYPALWHNLADRRFMDELRRWIEKSSGKTGGETKTETPNDLVDLAKAIEVFDVSRTHLKRLIKSGELKSYRKYAKGKHYISVKEAKHRLTVQPKYK
jgi:hypothetical protein